MARIDASVYPDCDPPTSFQSDEERADNVARVCGAWDFGLQPEEQTFALFAGWRGVFDRFPIPCSPAYRAFRTIFRWPQVPCHEPIPVRPRWLVDDLAEGRDDTSRLA